MSIPAIIPDYVMSKEDLAVEAKQINQCDVLFSLINMNYLDEKSNDTLFTNFAKDIIRIITEYNNYHSAQHRFKRTITGDKSPDDSLNVIKQTREMLTKTLGAVQTNLAVLEQIKFYLSATLNANLNTQSGREWRVVYVSRVTRNIEINTVLLNNIKPLISDANRVIDFIEAKSWFSILSECDTNSWSMIYFR